MLAPMAVRVLVLGPVEVVDDGGDVVASARGERQRRLLAALAAARGRPVEPDTLVDAVWGEALPSDPAAALHSQVRRLRRAVGADAIRTDAAGYRLVADLDVDRFEALVDAADGAAPEAAVDRLTEAVALWRGRALAEVADLPIGEAEAARLEERRVVAEERLAAALLAAGRLDEAAAAAEALAARHPLRERPVVVLMTARHGTGRTADALRAYQRFRERLVDDLGLDPSDELRQLESRILRGEPVVPPAAGAATTVPAGAPGPAPPPDEPVAARTRRAGPALPRPVSSFVGRDDDLRRLLALVPDCRCLTITGPGGVGKTRLVLEVAAAVADRFPDGVDLVRLDAIGDPADLLPAVGAHLGVRDRSDTAPIDRLVDALAGEQRLLVLDSCDHVVAEAAALAEALVQRTDGVTVLATSREALRIDGERTWPLRPLAPRGAARTMFLDRARAAAPRLDADDPATSALVDQLCERLDGLPLALELAAARLRVMPLDTLVAALDDDLAVLGGGSRTADARHRSVAALVGWTVDRLPPTEQRLLARVSVFAGPFDRSAAASVATAGPGDGGSTTAPTAVDHQLWELVDRSLVVPDADGTGRYALLEVVRADGRRRLAAEGCRGEVEAAHAAWVRRLTSEVGAAIGRAGTAGALARFDAARAEVRAAVERSLAAGDPMTAVEVLAPLFDVAQSRADAELHTWVDRTLATLPPTAAGPAVTAARGIACTAAWLRGDRERGLDLGRRAVDAAPDDPAARWAEEALGDLHVAIGDLIGAVAHYRRAAELADRVGDDARSAMSRGSAAIALGYAGEHDEASTQLASAWERAGSVGELAQGWLEYFAGECALDIDPDTAEAHLARALDLARPLGADLLTGVAGLSLLTLRSRRRPGSVPVDELADLIDLFHRSGNRTVMWTAVRALIGELARRGEPVASARLAGALAASPHAAPIYGADADRLAEADAANRAALGARWEVETRAGGALDESAALALARASAARLRG